MNQTTSKELDKMWLYFSPLFVGLLALDQVSKWWAILHLTPGTTPKVGLELSKNNGIVFGIDLPQWAIWVLALAVLGLTSWLVIENKLWRDRWHLTGLALILSGAIGNLIDRLRLGYVVDFIKVYWWPNFNLADAFIVVGVLLLAYGFFVREDTFSEL